MSSYNIFAAHAGEPPPPEEKPWQRFEKTGGEPPIRYVHVVPMQDRITHVISESCMCEPRVLVLDGAEVETVRQVNHVAIDGRPNAAELSG